MVRCEKMKILKLILFTSILIMSLPIFLIGAQQNQSQSHVPRKLDEYSYGSGSGMRVGNDCDVDAHLDNFAYFLKQEPSSRGYMIFYRGKRKPPKYFAYDPEWQFSQLNIEWGFEKGRIVLVDGGYRNEAMMELWIVPEGTDAPKPSPTITSKGRKKS